MTQFNRKALRENVEKIIPLLLGLVTFILVAGIKGLDPSNIGWLDTSGDLSLHYLSWAFYRQGPWTIPPGLNPDYGLDISSSIVYSDSIPLFAFIFKLLSPVLSEPFQYFGIWYAICFIFQAYFSWLLIGLIKPNWTIRSLATVLFLFAPPFLIRVGFHASFCAQFLIIASLYQVLRPQIKSFNTSWILLIAAAALINGYILFMVLLIYLGNLMDLALTQKIMRPIIAIKELCLSLIVLLFSLWLAGYFVPGASGGEFGFKKMNLLGPLLPGSWSYLVNTPQAWNHFEGFNYLGLGLIFLVIYISFHLIQSKFPFKPAIKKHQFFCLSILVLGCISISNNIGILGFELRIPLTESLLNLASTFRSSGRMFWPLFYLILFFSIYFANKIFGKYTVLVLGFICTIQIIDTSAGWLTIRSNFGQSASAKFDSELIARLINPFWNDAGKKYRNVLIYPIQRDVLILPYGWNTWAYYATVNHMATNSVFLGRYDQKKISNANIKIDNAIASGIYDLNSLYIFNDLSVLPVLSTLNQSKDLFINIDGYNVLAPNWKTCDTCTQYPHDKEIIKRFSIPSIGSPIYFSKNGTGVPYLMNIDGKETIGHGWGWPEDWGVWSEGKSAQLVIPLANLKPRILTINCRALIAPNHPTQTIDISINGGALKSYTLNKPDENLIAIELPSYQSRNYIAIQFEFNKNLTSPKILGIGDDNRLLGVGLTSITLD